MRNVTEAFARTGARTSVTNLLKKRLRHKCFTENFAKFLRTPFFTEHLWATASLCTASALRTRSAPCQVLTMFVCCLTINSFSIFLCSDQIITKDNHLQSKTNFFSQLKTGRSWFGCFAHVFSMAFFFFYYSFTIMKLRITFPKILFAWLLVWPLIKSCSKTKNPWFENYKLLLFCCIFGFLGFLISRLILTP